MLNAKARSKVVVIGGGTGSSSLLQGLKRQAIDLTALVGMTDDGGSTGILRDELGVLPPGDVRQCLVALSEAPTDLQTFFNFRLPSGSWLAGHAFGNIFLSAAEKMTNDFTAAIGMAGELLHIRGRVLPLTMTACELVMRTANEEIVGQNTIQMTNLPAKAYPQLSLRPNVPLSPPARQAIREADLVVIAPGELYTSLAPALLVDGMAAALRAATAPLAYVANLVNKPNHTRDFTVYDYAAEIERFCGGRPLDYVLYSVDDLSAALLQRYASQGQYPVVADERALKSAHFTAIAGRFLSRQPVHRDPNDLLERSLIRHDGDAVAASLLKLIP